MWTLCCQGPEHSYRTQANQWFYHVVLSCDNSVKDKILAKLFPTGPPKAPAPRLKPTVPEVEMVDVVNKEKASTGVKIGRREKEVGDDSDWE